MSQQNNQLTFQVIGFAIGSPETGAMAVYSLNKPLMGVIDPSQNTLQVDLSNLDNVIDEAGFIDSSQLYGTMRTSQQVSIINIYMDYEDTEGPQMIFSVNSLDIVPPDGRMQAFSLQEPTQLIFDALSHRMYTVAVPQLVDTFSDLYTSSYQQVLPVVYSQPVPVMAPIFVPNLVPHPIYATPFIGFNPFYFGSGFVRFYDFDRFHGRFPIHDRYLGRNEFNDFHRTRASYNRVTTGGIRTGDVNINRVGAGGQIGRGDAGIGQGSNLRPGNIGDRNRISAGGVSSGANRIGTGGMTSGANRIGTGGMTSGANRISSGAGMRAPAGGMGGGARTGGGGGRRR